MGARLSLISASLPDGGSLCISEVCRITLLDVAGIKDIRQHDTHQAPGLDIHEMGGARMGHDPKTSLLNAHNQLHHCKNVFVTDGACMTSTGNQSPSILYMAFAARAAHFAAEEMKKGNL